MERVFLTGGTGFIGQATVKALLAEGINARILTRNVDRARALFPPEVEFVQGMDAETLSEGLSGIDGIINLAGEPVLPGRWTADRKRRIVDSRVKLTRRLVAAAAVDPKPRVLVSASGVGFYGRDTGSEPRIESSAPGDDFLAQLCVDWEAAAREAEAVGLRVTCIRIGLVLGQGGGALEQLLTPFKLGVGGRIGSGRQYMPWIHIDDLASMLVTAITDANFPKIANGAGPTPVTNDEFTRTLGRVLKRPTLLPVPGFALKAAFGEAGETLLGGQNAVPAAAEAHGFNFRFQDLESCLRDVLCAPDASVTA